MASSSSSSHDPHDTHASHKVTQINEKVSLGGQAPFFFPLLAMGIVGLLVALGAVLTIDKANPGFGRFYHAYLVAFCFCLSISLGSLFFVIVGHIFRAAWSVNVRRIFETFASALPFLGVLSIPFFVTVWRGDAMLYHWAVPKTEIHQEHGDEKYGDEKHGAQKELHSQSNPVVTLVSDEAKTGPTEKIAAKDSVYKSVTPNNEINPETVAPKKPVGYHTAYGYNTYDEFTDAKYTWLNPTSFTVRIIGYFFIWTLLAWFFYRNSVRQDSTGDIELTRKMSRVAPVCMVVFGTTLYFASIDLVMTLDHHWYSSMFGIQFFAGSVIGAFASVIVTVNLLHRGGYLTQSVTTEHLHDLGKLMFGFIVFWAYVTYSQYMLIWYANLPETTGWFERRGATTSAFAPGAGYWSGISIILLFCHLLLPFPFLLSRHIKRNRDLLFFGAVWMLVFHWVDLYWNIMPELNNGQFYFGLPEIGTLVGVVGLFLAFISYRLSRVNLRPIKDPRVSDSFAFQNM